MGAACNVTDAGRTDGPRLGGGNKGAPTLSIGVGPSGETMPLVMVFFLGRFCLPMPHHTKAAAATMTPMQKIDATRRMRLLRVPMELLELEAFTDAMELLVVVTAMVVDAAIRKLTCGGEIFTLGGAPWKDACGVTPDQAVLGTFLSHQYPVHRFDAPKRALRAGFGVGDTTLVAQFFICFFTRPLTAPPTTPPTTAAPPAMPTPKPIGIRPFGSTGARGAGAIVVQGGGPQGLGLGA